jgi:hypothetical protein
MKNSQRITSCHQPISLGMLRKNNLQGKKRQRYSTRGKIWAKTWAKIQKRGKKKNRAEEGERRNPARLDHTSYICSQKAKKLDGPITGLPLHGLVVSIISPELCWFWWQWRIPHHMIWERCTETIQPATIKMPAWKQQSIWQQFPISVFSIHITIMQSYRLLFWEEINQLYQKFISR